MIRICKNEEQSTEQFVRLAAYTKRIYDGVEAETRKIIQAEDETLII